jgi:two-component system response regulator HydG
MSLEQVEKEFIMTTLASVAGNKAKAATILRISRHTLYDKLKKYGVL